MAERWENKIKDVLKKGKKKLDDGYERIKQAEQFKLEEKARKEQEKAEENRKQKIKDNRRRLQEERIRIKREAVNSRIMLVTKILCLLGVVVWACWFITDFVHNYDSWVAKYHKWSIEYEAQAPARTVAKIKYQEKKKLEAMNAEKERQERNRKEELASREEFNYFPETRPNNDNFHSGKSEAKIAKDLSDTFNSLDMNDPNFDVGSFCLEKEKRGILTFEECIGAAVLKGLAR